MKTVKGPPIKRGWVIYHKKYDKFMIEHTDGRLDWSEDFDNLKGGWRPLFCHTQADVVKIFFKGLYKKKLIKWTKDKKHIFRRNLYENTALVNARGNEEIRYVESTNFGWVVPIGRFDREYTLHYGVPEIEKWVSQL